MKAPSARRLGALQLAIIGLTSATAIIHLRVTDYSPWDPFGINGFVLVAVAYFLFLALGYLAGGRLDRYRRLIRWLFLGYTVGLVVGWIWIGQRIVEAYVAKAVEVALIVLLYVEDRRALG